MTATLWQRAMRAQHRTVGHSLTHLWTGGILELMQTDYAQFTPGQPVKRLNDGAPGVVQETGPWGNVWVTWNQSGLTTVINGRQIERA
jgi:hypothetical protein